MQFSNDIILVNWGTLLIWFLEDIVIYLRLFFDKIGSKQSVCCFAQPERLFNVRSHGLLLHTVLPLLCFVVIVIHLVQILIHALLV